MPSSILIQEIPTDLKKYILLIQGEIKTQKGVGQYSQQSTILQIIREHRECRGKVKPIF